VNRERTCRCKPDCPAIVKSADAVYAVGHYSRTVKGRLRRVPRVSLVCKSCGRTTAMTQRRLAYQRTRELTSAGLTHLCHRCNGVAARDQLKRARASLVRRYYDDGARTPAQIKAGLQQHIRLVVKAKEKAKEKRSGEATISEWGRLRKSLGKLARSHRRTGEFRLCPLCHKVKYVYPERIHLSDRESIEGRRPSRGFHRGCSHAWRKTERYKTWRRQIGDLHSPLLPLRLKKFPEPWPPVARGDSPRPTELDRYFRWTLRHFFFGESWREIGIAEGFRHGTIRLGVVSFVDRLPVSWVDVFGRKHFALRLDEILPTDLLGKRAHPETPREFAIHP
jgi:hypothetical protein